MFLKWPKWRNGERSRLRELHVKEGTLNAEMVENLELCMHLRYETDNSLTYHQESAETAIKYAEEFLNNTLKLL